MRNWVWVVLSLCAFAVMPARAADTAPAGSCAENEELDGKTCFPKCQDDGYTRYEGDGDECLQICPSNSQDHGHVCLMGPAQLLKKKYKRGPGRPLTYIFTPSTIA